jgi:hypothetical protein
MKALSVLLLLLLVPIPTQAAALWFDPPHSDVLVGDTVTVALESDQLTDLLAFTVTLGYDAAIVQPATVLPGEVVTEAPCPYFWFVFPPTAGDTLRLDAAALGCRWSGSGTLARLRFIGLRDGITELHYLYGQLRDSQNDPISITWGSALLSVHERPVRVLPTTWGKVRALYR